MFGFFKTDPIKKKEKEYAKMMEKARDIQRSGDIKGYSKMVAEAEELMDEIEQLKANKKE